MAEFKSAGAAVLIMPLDTEREVLTCTYKHCTDPNKAGLCATCSAACNYECAYSPQQRAVWIVIVGDEPGIPICPDCLEYFA